ncbi:TPA: glycosyltransferase [Clostridium perfringens]|uniref:Glycosyltransferase n=1 Tax=Clostridium perfringens TaxID=1502 RepID=A0AAW9I5I3_CLOPF|nr:glycosyltransferase [Clostridium perfringens]MDU3642834.1 glycosyltransferase [Clostridium perfringens]MDZ4909718.1 glycosyltransferase [Clostridium perfringens]
MKKKIAFVISTFMIGGQEKALISMLNNIPKDKYDITVLALFNEGDLKDFVPEWVKVKIIPKYNSNIKVCILNSIKNIEFISAIKKLYYSINVKLSKTKAQHNYYTAKLFPYLDEKYDVIIHYHSTESFILHYVAYRTKAKLKIAWIHSDVSNNFTIDKKIFKNIYSKYDKIFSVSQTSLDKFIKYFPETKNKIEVLYNIVDSKEIFELANKEVGFDDNFNGIRILTVGRLCADKGQDKIPYIVRRLIDDGYNLKWYLVGDGDSRSIIEDKIKKLKIEKNLILLGSKINPYPYIKECDIYVQPSVSEGFCISLFEARCLNKPVISTNFNGATEQIIDGQTGYIVPVNNNHELYLKIRQILNNSDIAEKFSYNLSLQNHNTISELDKLYKVIDKI